MEGRNKRVKSPEEVPIVLPGIAQWILDVLEEQIHKDWNGVSKTILIKDIKYEWESIAGPKDEPITSLHLVSIAKIYMENGWNVTIDNEKNALVFSAKHPVPPSTDIPKNIPKTQTDTFAY